MSDLQELYQEVIIDHSRHPRNFRPMDGADRKVEGHNPLCGDHLSLYLKMSDGRIDDLSFQGVACAISTASASIMTSMMKGRSKVEADEWFRRFHKLLTSDIQLDPMDDQFGELAALIGVRRFPIRVKCATLAWHALNAALTSHEGTITTE